MMNKARKIQALHRIQNAIYRGQRPKPPTVGLTEKEFEEMADEELFELRFSSDDPQWDDYNIQELSDKALGLLANSEPLPRSPSAKMFRVVAGGFWDLVKVASGVLIGWYLKKHYGQ